MLSFGPLTGLAFIPEHNSLLVSLSSSALYFFEVSPALRLVHQPDTHSAATLTRAGRELFEEIVIRTGAPGMTRSKPASGAGSSAVGRISRKDGPRVMGLVHLEGSAHADKIGKVAFIFE